MKLKKTEIYNEDDKLRYLWFVDQNDILQGYEYYLWNEYYIWYVVNVRYFVNYNVIGLELYNNKKYYHI